VELQAAWLPDMNVVATGTDDPRRIQLTEDRHVEIHNIARNRAFDVTYFSHALNLITASEREKGEDGSLSYTPDTGPSRHLLSV
jgi:hypothetical protein